MVGAFAYGDTALVERLVEGDEVAVPVIDTGDGPRRPARGLDRARRRGLRLHRALHRRQHGVHGAREALRRGGRRPAPGSRSTAHQALGLRDLSRSDLIVDADGEVWFLEVNVAPGLTETSTVPLSVTAAGLDLGALMAELVDVAVRRG